MTFILLGIGSHRCSGRNQFKQKNKMRVTHTPYKTKTRAIGSDLEMTLALIGALKNPTTSKLGKFQKIATTLAKLLK
jgi:hypothetical protein